MNAVAMRMAAAISALAGAVVVALVLGLYAAADTGAQEGGSLARPFALLGASAILVLVAAVTWRVRRGLAPLHAEAERMEQRLQAAIDREREFSGHVAHELRTPLTVLQTGLELARRKQPAGSDVHERIGELLDTVEEMRQLTENLLLLARVERGAEATQLQSVALHPLVESVWRRAADKAERRGLVFRNEVPADGELQADRGKLQLVVQNLIANAVSYTEAGGTIVVSAGADTLSIWDSGPQLREDQLARAFDRMWRADVARTDATQHAGLGLSLARALCRHMGLDLGAENVASGGIRFVVAPRRAHGAAAPREDDVS